MSKPDDLDQDERPDDDVDDTIVETLATRRSDTPVTLSQLAALKGESRDVVDARVQIIETLRRASLRLTHPEDWVLFKAKDEQGGQIVGYLQDAGCDRVRDLWGIEIFDISKPEKVAGNDPGVFHYLIAGSGRCKLTRQTLESVEGGRSSSDDYIQKRSPVPTGAELDLLVRKSARANLDGTITRELAGMKSVPIDELRAAWSGTNKKVEQCRHGRGFGSIAVTRDDAPDVPPPVCVHCGKAGVYRRAKDDRGAFYGCPDWASHKDKKWVVDAAKWIAERQQPAAAGATSARQPGQEG